MTDLTYFRVDYRVHHTGVGKENRSQVLLANSTEIAILLISQAYQEPDVQVEIVSVKELGALEPISRWAATPTKMVNATKEIVLNANSFPPQATLTLNNIVYTLPPGYTAGFDTREDGLTLVIWKAVPRDQNDNRGGRA